VLNDLHKQVSFERALPYYIIAAALIHSAAATAAIGGKLLMAGAGMRMPIFNQMGQFPIDVLGDCGPQYADFNFITIDDYHDFPKVITPLL